MKKWFLLFGALVLVSVGLMYSYYSLSKPAEEEKPKVIKAVNEMTVEEKEEFEEQTKFMDGETTLPIKLGAKEHEIWKTMHLMTHQKIKAKDKWGGFEMSESNIQTVLKILEGTTYDTSDKMIEIATRWKNGDFSKAVHDHNYFWSLQGGTIGKAYGLMNADEEKAYVEKNYR